MELTLHTECVIDSSHYLRGYKGKCEHMHGHTWRVRIWIRGEHNLLDPTGILFDFGRVNLIKKEFDHKIINEVSPFDVVNPTAENITKYIWEFLRDIEPDLKYKVRVYETSIGKKTYCEGGDF